MWAIFVFLPLEAAVGACAEEMLPSLKDICRLKHLLALQQRRPSFVFKHA
jgi:hypothetical protein